MALYSASVGPEGLKPLDSKIANQPLPDGKSIDELADQNASKLKPLEELQNQDNIFKNDLGNSGAPGNDMSSALPAEVVKWIFIEESRNQYRKGELTSVEKQDIKRTC